MADLKTIPIRDSIGELCVEYDAGQNVYSEVLDALNSGHDVALDFDGVEVFASPFFNAAVGQLLRVFTPDELNRRVSFPNLNASGRSILRRATENAKEFYGRPAHQRAVIDAIRRSGEGTSE